MKSWFFGNSDHKKKDIGENIDPVEIYLNQIITYAENTQVLDKNTLVTIRESYIKDRKFKPQKQPKLPFYEPFLPPISRFITGIGILYSIILLLFFKITNKTRAPQMMLYFQGIVTDIKKEGNRNGDLALYENALAQETWDPTSIVLDWMVYILCLYFVILMYDRRQYKLAASERKKIIEETKVRNEEEIQKNEIVDNQLKTKTPYSDSLEDPTDFSPLRHATIVRHSGVSYSNDKLIEGLEATGGLDFLTQKKCAPEDLIPNPIIDLIIYIAANDKLTEIERNTWLATILQDPLGAVGELFDKPVIYSDGLICSAKNRDKLNGKNPITGATLSAPIKNITLRKFLEKFSPDLAKKNIASQKNIPTKKLIKYLA